MPAFGPVLSRLTRTLLRRPELAPDGRPFPPERLIHTVAGTRDPGWFWHGGELGARALREILARRQRGLADSARILDFGCGCGRVIRHVHAAAPESRLHGTDYNAALVQWCRRHLPFATFSSNELAPPTRHADDSFDLIYAFSVFTHLTEPLQHAWLAELRRILAPCGYLILTTHGDRYLEKLSGEDRARYLRGAMVVWSGESAGQNRCATFHPPAWVRDVMAPRAGLAVLEHVVEGALGNPHQDAWLLQRPERCEPARASTPA